MTSLLGSRRSGVGPGSDKPHAAERPHPEDAFVFPPTRLPTPIGGKEDAVWRVGKYVFRADFDSANLSSVEQGAGPNEFFLQTRRDCGGTANEKATRTWFYFSMSGQSTGDLVALTILNLNKQSRLYSQDYRPVFWCESQQEWQPLKLRVTYRREDEDFQLRFCHRFESEEETLFAFAIPFSYQETQDLLDHLDELFPCDVYGSLPLAPAAPDAGGSPDDAEAAPPASAPTTPRGTPTGATAGCSGEQGPFLRHGLSGPCSAHATACSNCSTSAGGGNSRIYYRRQLLTHSLEGRRVEVITITDCSGAGAETEPPLPGVFEHDPGPPAALFREKTVYFVSSRVHPGETPASHMFNGMLAFLLRRGDARAAALRRRFVFKLVPLVNPDGVAVGNYRTDTLGQNLNRFYNGVPDETTQPSVYAIKTLLMYYANIGLLEYYLDLHAHANKKGVFIYGNTLEDGEAHLQSLLYAKLVALNNPSFDFVGCNYTEKNMSRADKDGASKEGAGRVALYRETGLTHLYTVEANYNMARTLNVVAPATGDHGGRASPPCNKRFPPKFTVSAFHAVGRAILIAALDMEGANPWSRLPHSEHRSLEGVRSWLLTVLRATPETRAAHLPPMSDTAVEVLRGMIASGALRVSALPSSGRSRQRSSSLHAFDAAGAGSGGGQSTVVAFGRSISSALAVAPRRLPPQPSANRRSNGTLPSIGGASHSSTPLTPSSAAGMAVRRAPGRTSIGGSSGESLARSSSLPGRNSTPPATQQSPLSTAKGGPSVLDKDPGSDPSSSSERMLDEEVVEVTTIAADPARGSADGPSDSDGDQDLEDAPARVVSPSPSTSPLPVQGSARFRYLEPPVRNTPAYSFKGAAVYCNKVTEFKFPLSDRLVGGAFDGPLNTAILGDPSIRGSLMVGAPGLGSVIRSRPPSAGGARRPLSAGRSASPVNATPSAAASAGSARASRAGSSGGQVGVPNGASSALNPQNMVLPRTMGNGAAVLMTTDQLGSVSGNTAVTPKSRSTLSFARSSSANRRNR